MAADPREWMWAEACAMIERAEQMHRQFFRPVPAPTPTWEPPADIFESERGLTILVALPGVETDDVTVSVDDGGILLIAGVRRMPAAARGTAIRRLEIPHGRFERRIRLAGGRWKIERSALENGCLTLGVTQAA